MGKDEKRGEIAFGNRVPQSSRYRKSKFPREIESDKIKNEMIANGIPRTANGFAEYIIFLNFFQ